MTKGVRRHRPFRRRSGGAASWQEILDSSIRGSYHIYEGARRNCAKRVVYASSVHAIGYHRLEDANRRECAACDQTASTAFQRISSKSLSRLYWDKFGIETVCCRIFSSFDQYTDRRMLWSMLTFDDCVRLVTASLTAPRVAHSIIFGTSSNRHKMVDNRLAGHIGFEPQDSTEAHRAEVEARLPAADPDAPAVRYLGGWFVNLGHPDDKSK
jgi:uronate dehydrogenase